jgi:hypothetical protein
VAKHGNGDLIIKTKKMILKLIDPSERKEGYVQLDLGYSAKQADIFTFFKWHIEHYFLLEVIDEAISNRILFINREKSQYCFMDKTKYLMYPPTLYDDYTDGNNYDNKIFNYWGSNDGVKQEFSSPTRKKVDEWIKQNIISELKTFTENQNIYN